MYQCKSVGKDSPEIQNALQIAERIWWVGHYLDDDIFQCHAYLIEHGENSILIDPGGSQRTFDHVYRKIKQVIPFSHVRYFLCHHQDPDITGALTVIDKIEDRCPEAEIITHWRAKELIKHYDLSMPFWEIEENGWRLDLGGRVLKFIFTPYLHFPGAFCTFDETSGVMFSSDIFGGFTENWSLIARDESYFEDLRPFHEHYMPSRELLLHGLLKLEKHPIKMIAPQHGSIIPQHLVSFMMGKLKQLDCGIYALAQDKTDIRYLSSLTKTLKDITNTIILYRDFQEVVSELMRIFRRVVPVSSLEFCATTQDKNVLVFAQENRFRGELLKDVPGYCALFELTRNEWSSENTTCYKSILLPAKEVSYRGKVQQSSFIIPLFSPDQGICKAVAAVRLEHEVEVTSEIEQMLDHMSHSLSVAVERESLYRMIDIERQNFYQQSIRDALTGLYNRLYMEDMAERLMHKHDRNIDQSITLLLIDLDHFKQINDTYGHGEGDKALKRVASMLKTSTRAEDFLVRLGGEEFALFATGLTEEESMKVGEKLRKIIAGMKFPPPLNKHQVSISVGVALRNEKEPLDCFMHRADKALYEAKRSGRNRVCFARSSL